MPAAPFSGIHAPPDPSERALDLTGTKAAKPSPTPAPVRQVAPGVVEINGKLETRDYMPPKLPHWGGELLLGGEGRDAS